jgi:hypothetical protein
MPNGVLGTILCVCPSHEHVQSIVLVYATFMQTCLYAVGLAEKMFVPSLPHAHVNAAGLKMTNHISMDRSSLCEDLCRRKAIVELAKNNV